MGNIISNILQVPRMIYCIATRTIQNMIEKNYAYTLIHSEMLKCIKFNASIILKLNIS